MRDDLQSQMTPLCVEEEATRHTYDKRLLRRLDSNDLIARREAIQECRRLPVERILGLLHTLETKPRHAMRGKRKRVLCWTFAACVSALALLALGVVTGPMLWLLLPLFLWAAIASTPVKIYSARAESSLAIVIAEIRDPAFLPIALRRLHAQQTNALGDPASEMTKAFSRSASYLLKTLDIEDIKTLGIRQREYYWFLIHWRAMPRTAIRVLQILEAVGTPGAIPTVQVIRDETGWRDQHPVRDAARACLVVLKEREKEARLPRTLLRASQAPAPSADTLLRPAVEASSDDPAHLLHPAATQTAVSDVSETRTHGVLQAQPAENIQNTRM